MALSASVRVNYNADESMSENISSQITGFSYTDVASGKSDSINISLMNVNKEWISSKMPQKGATLQATIKTKEWRQGEPAFDCGVFLLDDISFSGRPLNCNIGAVSAPNNEDFKTKKKTITWQSTTLKDVAQKISKAANLQLYYSGNNIKITDLEQSEETDSAFLYGLCEKYGFSMKVFNKKIIIFETAEAEQKAAVLTIDEKEMNSWSYNTSINGSYTGIEFNYTDPDAKSKDKQTIKVFIGKQGRIYSVKQQATSKYDAELQAKALLAKANRSIDTLTVTIRANNLLVAGQCVQIKGLGKINGKYYIEQIKHSIGNGYNMQLSMYCIEHDKAKTSNGSGGGNGSNNSTTDYKTISYTISSSDTLWAIAKRFLGDGKRYPEIYELNKDIIETTARSRGMTSSDNGHWIFKGTVIKIRVPEV